MTDWILYTFFPAARERDFQDFLTIEALSEKLTDAGFRNLGVNKQIRQENEDLAHFLAYASHRYRTSQLMAIPDQEYDASIAMLDHQIKSSNAPISLASHICLVTIRADKPL